KSRQQCLMPNGITSQDAALVAQHVVNIITLTTDQQAAAHTAGLPDITSLDAAFIAQWVVGICGAAMNHAGEWRFRRSSETMWTTGTSFYSYPSGVLDQNLTGQDFRAVILGDVTGDWSPTGPNRPMGQSESSSSVRAMLPITEASAGSIISVPFRLSELEGQGVLSYQFDVRYDPAVITPRQVPIDLTGTNAANLGVAYNIPEPGLLKVAV